MALIEGRLVKHLAGLYSGESVIKLKDDESVYSGGMIAINELGEIVPASDTLGLRVLGNTERTVSDVAGSDADVDPAYTRIHSYVNSATFPITARMKGQVAYVEDDETVAASSVNLVPAGVIHDVFDGQVFINQTNVALAYALTAAKLKVIAVAASAPITAAQAHQGNVAIHVDTAGGVVDMVLPAAVQGYRLAIAVSGPSANAAQVSPDGADTVLGGSTQIENAVNAVSNHLWLEVPADAAWLDAGPTPVDVANWVAS